jgi:hypothetical protein
LIPTLSKKKTEKIDLGQGKSIRLPKYEYKTYTEKVPRRFTYKTKDGKIERTYRPRKLFFNQNKGLKRATGKYSSEEIKKRVEEATRMPEMTFSLKPVALIKPSYGEVVL